MNGNLGWREAQTSAQSNVFQVVSHDGEETGGTGCGMWSQGSVYVGVELSTVAGGCDPGTSDTHCVRKGARGVGRTI